MEEILASIRRIIADDQETAKAAEPAPVEAPPEPLPFLARPIVEPVSPPSPPEPTIDEDDDVLDLADLLPPSPPPPPPAAAAPPPVSQPVPAPPPEVVPTVAPSARFPDLDLAPLPSREEPPHDSGPEPASFYPAPEPSPAEPRPERSWLDQVPPEPAVRAGAPIPMPDLRPDTPSERLVSSATDTAVSQAFNALSGTLLTSNARTLEDLVREMLKPMLKSWLDDNLPSLVERLVRAEIERVTRGGR